MLKKLLLAGFVAMLVTGGARADAMDVVVVTMSEDGATNKIQTHPQPVRRKGCVSLPSIVTSGRKSGKKFKITLVDKTKSKHTGYAIKINCIRPDGSVYGD